MWGILAKILSGPIIGGLTDAYKARLAAGNTADRIAADIAVKELEVQKREIEVDQQLKVAEIGKWYEPSHLFAYIMVIFFAKVIIWDKVLGDITGGRTDPLQGDVATWGGMVFTFYLGRRGFENVARILKR